MEASIFREYDIRGTHGQTLTDEVAYRIGLAYGQWLSEEYDRKAKVCTCYDGRISSPALFNALTRGLREQGHDILHLGVGPTPMLYYAVFTENADAGIMITGSHNPPDQNGLKMMMGKKPFYGQDIQKLYRMAGCAQSAGKQGALEEKAIMPPYLSTLMEAYNKGGSSLKVAWDAGNGAAGEVMAQLTAKLPGEHILLNEIIDGTFPAHHPDPSDPKNMQQLAQVVRDEKCDLGIAFDGDGDRIGVVDEQGNIISAEQLLMFFAQDVLSRNPGTTIIADVKTTQCFFDEVERLGGKALMWKTGHSNIKMKMMETGAKLAGEQSGHIFFADRYYGFDDGLYAAVRLLSWLSLQEKSLSELQRGLPFWPNSPEIRLPSSEERKFAVVEEVKARLQVEGAEFSGIDGVRVLREGGWWLLRASNTQAILVARVEARDQENLSRLQQELLAYLADVGIQLTL